MRDKFWYIIVALSLVNFGITFILAGIHHMTAHEILIDMGGWMVLGGIAVLVWLVTRNGNGGNHANG